MFDRRLKIILVALALFGTVLIYRLAGMQIIDNQQYLKAASAPETIPFKPIPANRGRIFARGPGGKGTVELIANEPCFEVAVYYPVMNPDEWWDKSQIRRLRIQMREEAKNSKLEIPREELALRLRQELDQFWKTLSQNANLAPNELFDRRDRIVQAIQNRLQVIRKMQQEKDLYANDPVSDQRMFYPIVTDLNETEALNIRGKLPANSWAVVRPSIRRVYRQKETFCHILGRTERIPGSPAKTFAKPKREILIQSDKDCLPGEMRGTSGLEMAYDDLLRGRRGWLALGKDQRIETPADDGKDITLTLDIDLQEFIQKRLVEQIKSVNDQGKRNFPYATGGAAVVLDLQKSELLALVSVPTYDITEYPNQQKELNLNHKYQPLINRAIHRYPPGSIVKPLVGAWAIEHGNINSTRAFLCTGKFSEKLPSFRCWKHDGHGQISFIDALVGSCDVFFYHVGEIVTAEGMIDLYNQTGITQPVPIKLPNQKGRVPTQAWFISHHGRGISQGDAMNLAIGQGDVEITPLQAALMTGALITGRLQPPKILTEEPLPDATPIGISPNPLRMAREGMRRAVADENGTAKAAKSTLVAIAAKTGSAQASPKPVKWKITYKDPDTGLEHEETTANKDGFAKKYIVARQNITVKSVEGTPVPQWDLSYKHPVTQEIIKHRFNAPPDIKEFHRQYFIKNRTVKSVEFEPVMSEKDKLDPNTGRIRTLSHAWIIGFAPTDRPRIVCVVFLEYGIAGGSSCGPILKDIMEKCRDLGYIKSNGIK
jgi:cell division protein FtsI/penicillin-binding protein 2